MLVILCTFPIHLPIVNCYPGTVKYSPQQVHNIEALQPCAVS